MGLNKFNLTRGGQLEPLIQFRSGGIQTKSIQREITK